MQLPKNMDHIELKLADLTLQFTPSDNPFISREEIVFLIQTALLKKGNMLEIGVNRGKTTNNLARVAKSLGCRFIGVDVTEVPSTICDAQGPGECLPSNQIGCDISEENRAFVEIKLINPNDPNSLSNFLASLGLKFDFIFIDGDHSYPGVKKDYESVLPYVSENGVMVFHDAWWDVHPYPVKGPMMLLEELGGYIINKTHLGILKSDVHKII